MGLYLKKHLFVIWAKARRLFVNIRFSFSSLRWFVDVILNIFCCCTIMIQCVIWSEMMHFYQKDLYAFLKKFNNSHKIQIILQFFVVFSLPLLCSSWARALLQLFASFPSFPDSLSDITIIKLHPHQVNHLQLKQVDSILSISCQCNSRNLDDF